ncbi:unnamed protein product [Coffea canephora]|uniref:Uncharacterized protein n=1 Tax=Coffea canephora TaxID=49390 RepID=A0A068UDL0_COFCA|nr:unnamed protein product [Coffea canephora]
MRQIKKEVNDSIRRIINSKLKAMKAGESCDDDFLDRLLESNSQEIHEHGSKDVGMTAQKEIEECELFHFAGQAVTTFELIFSSKILLGNPPAPQPNPPHTKERILALFWRKSSQGGLNFFLLCTCSYDYITGNYAIICNAKAISTVTLLFAGILILKLLALIYHDPELWGDNVKEFKPKRFPELSHFILQKL